MILIIENLQEGTITGGYPLWTQRKSWVVTVNPIIWYIWQDSGWKDRDETKTSVWSISRDQNNDDTRIWLISQDRDLIIPSISRRSRNLQEKWPIEYQNLINMHEMLIFEMEMRSWALKLTILRLFRLHTVWFFVCCRLLDFIIDQSKFIYFIIELFCKLSYLAKDKNLCTKTNFFR